MTINEIQDKIIAEMSQLDDWFDVYEYLIELGKSHPAMDESLKTQENALPGCQSKVWLITDKHNSTLHFSADSDSAIVKGLLALLLKVLNDQSPSEIASADLYFTEKIGLTSNLSPSRANGLATIISQIKEHARAHS
ncbi:Cysteine desulfuration protein SufE [Anaerohalosphaera lusitana]|uniref:Cysteine desulfuration protein SufE n=1 Tax=Anaerohalosphaera lusitana TaxID=1936003 RepID=A0A1U9NQE2_9BACT|nr:SufE family protein [Anaerohalosphaera lusitana]AQT70153.1 Cysteine desulfuration protein SufE [Anaerohalosphaera lusitana]